MYKYQSSAKKLDSLRKKACITLETNSFRSEQNAVTVRNLTLNKSLSCHMFVVIIVNMKCLFGFSMFSWINDHPVQLQWAVMKIDKYLHLYKFNFENVVTAPLRCVYNLLISTLLLSFH